MPLPRLTARSSSRDAPSAGRRRAMLPSRRAPAQRAGRAAQVAAPIIAWITSQDARRWGEDSAHQARRVVADQRVAMDEQEFFDDHLLDHGAHGLDIGLNGELRLG